MLLYWERSRKCGSMLHTASTIQLEVIALLTQGFLLQVFDDCHEGGEISPSNCIYMTEWLEF